MTRVAINRRWVAGGTLCVLMVAAGCSMERRAQEMETGTLARETSLVAISMQDLRQDLQSTEQQVSVTVAAMEQLATATQDLPQAYKAFSGQVARLNSMAQTTFDQAAQMREQWREYLAAWEEQIDQITTPELQQEAMQRRQAVRENYDNLRREIRQLDMAYQPLARQLQDIQRTLAVDLTQDGIQAAGSAFELASQSASNFQKQISQFANQVDTVAATLPTTTTLTGVAAR
jgi:chromosome segregation ATPase